jgi:CheY-like chemotaxis protein
VRREAERTRFARKSYTKPECVSRSPAKMPHLLRERLVAQLQPGKLSSLIDERFTPVLLVEDYRGNSRSIQDAARSENLHGLSCADASDSGLVHMLCQDLEWSGGARPDFLVLDLRVSGGDGPEIVRKTRKQFNLADVPLAILTTGDSEFEFTASSGEHNTWRISRVSDPAR